MSVGPMLSGVSQELPAPQDGDDAIETLLAALSAIAVARVEWTVYWFADETHVHDVVLFAATGREQQTLYDGELPAAWADALWQLTDLANPQTSTGTFALAVAERRVSHTGDAWMPEPELETASFAPEQIRSQTL